MDPFVGSGTTAATALMLDRSAVGVDLSEEYLRKHAIARVEGAALSRPVTTHLVARNGSIDVGDEVEEVE